MPTPISIIIPSFRCAGFLTRNLDSLVPCAALVPGLEILVQDGAGDAETAAAARTFLPRIPGLRVASEPDKNLYDAMNRAMEKASGDWLLFLGADEQVIAPEVLPRLLAAGERSGADIVQADIEIEGRNGGPPVRMDRTATPARIFAGEGFCHQAMLYRRSFVGGARYQVRYPIGADGEFNMRLMVERRAKIHHVRETLVRFGSTGISSRTSDLAWKRDRKILMRKLYPAKAFVLKAASAPVREVLRMFKKPAAALKFTDWLYSDIGA